MNHKEVLLILSIFALEAKTDRELHCCTTIKNDLILKNNSVYSI